MDAIWLSFPVGSAIAVVLAWLAYRLLPWRRNAEVLRAPPGRQSAAPA
jgi:Na+-driven multidrug efflux pump